MPPGHETRGHHQQSPPGESVFAPLGPWPRKHPSTDAGDQPHLAPTAGQSCSAPTPFGTDHDQGAGQKPSEVDGDNANRGVIPGLQVLPFGEGRPQQDNAVPALEPTAKEPGTNGATGTAHRGGTSESPKHTEVDGSQWRGRASTGPALDLDCGAPQHTGAVARSGQTGLSQFLAASTSASPTTEFGTHTAGQATSEAHVKYVPIFMNSTGTACFANAVVISLAWLTLLANGNDPS